MAAEDEKTPNAEELKISESSGKAAAPKGVKLHVKNLDEEISTEALKTIFEKCGTVKHADVKTNKEGKSKGFGQVIMATKEEAEKAIAELNDSKQGEKAMSVLFPPEPEKKETPQKADKGKGKGKEKSKGKGKGATQASYPDPNMNPYMMQPQMNPYMMMGQMPNMYGMDPVMSQIMQQQMLTMQLFGHMQAQQYQPPQAETGKKGKGKGKGPAKDKGTKVDGTFTGKLKSINFREDKGYGFIDCAETKATYGRDVYVSSDLVPAGAKAGDQYDFNVVLDQRGQLRATNVKSKA